MKLIILICLISNITLLHSRVIGYYQFNDTIIVVGEKYIDDLSRQRIDLKEYQSVSSTNYDIMNSLRIIGLNAAFDFNTMPYLEGGDFQEQQLFINNIPVPFQSRLIGMQSGLNSLLFSQITLLEAQSSNGYGKPIKLKLKTNSIDTSQIIINSKINILHFENAISFPVNLFSGGVTVGYNRSLLETIKPFISSSLNNTDDFEYKKFPFFQSFQALGELRIDNLTVKPIFIYSEDIGNFGINTKGFNFNSFQLNYGADVQGNLGKISTLTQLYSNKGRNNINYRFPEYNNLYIQGITSLLFEEFGFRSNLEYSIKPGQNVSLNFGYRNQNANSSNALLSPDNYKKASYSSDIFESTFYYQSLLSDKFLSTFYMGLNSFKFNTINPSVGIDISYFNPSLFDARLQVSHEAFQEPFNQIFYSFQNAIWDPGTTGSIFFIDNKDLPFSPMSCLNSSINLSKQINHSLFGTNVSTKIFFRSLKNLVYANNYPDEVNFYNSDFKFNQDFDGTRYGLSFLLENDFKPLLLKNLTAVNLIRSINYDNTNNLRFNAMNYSPFTLTNLVQYQITNFYAAVFFIYSSGRYTFDKKITSVIDSTVNYSVSSDFTTQSNLNPYYSVDISLLYKVVYPDYNINIGFSALNIFNKRNESRRGFILNESKDNLIRRSEYYNFPRFFIFEISISFTL
jgi:hypothetical protein